MKLRRYKSITLRKGKIRITLTDGSPNHVANIEGVELRLGLINSNNVICVECTYDDLKRLDKVVHRGLKRLMKDENNSTV